MLRQAAFEFSFIRQRILNTEEETCNDRLDLVLSLDFIRFICRN